jgi:hypothetical protein
VLFFFKIGCVLEIEFNGSLLFTELRRRRREEKKRAERMQPTCKTGTWFSMKQWGEGE